MSAVCGPYKPKGLVPSKGVGPSMGGGGNPIGVATLYDSNNAAIMPLATNSTTGSYLGKTYRTFGGAWNAGLALRCYGRKLVVSLLGFEDYLVRVDGVQTSLTNNGGVWGNFTLFNNVRDAWHNVEMQSTTESAASGILVESTNTFTLTSANGSITWPSIFSNPIYDCGGLNYVRVDGSMVLAAATGWSGNNFGGRIRFKATTDSIKIYQYGNACKLSLWRDGTWIKDFSSSRNDGAFDWETILSSADGLTSAVENEYWIISDPPVGSGPYSNAAGIYALKLSADNMNTSTFSAFLNVVFSGDSITQGYGLASNLYNRDCFVSRIARGKGWGWWNIGVPAQTLVGAVSASIPASINAKSPDKVVISYGTNDLGVTSDANFRNAIYDFLHAVCGGSATQIYVIGITPGTTNGATRTTFNGYWSAQCAGGPDASARSLTGAEVAKITYLDPASWIDTGTDLADTVHPNLSGHTKIANAFIAAT